MCDTMASAPMGFIFFLKILFLQKGCYSCWRCAHLHTPVSRQVLVRSGPVSLGSAHAPWVRSSKSPVESAYCKVRSPKKRRALADASEGQHKLSRTIHISPGLVLPLLRRRVSRATRRACDLASTVRPRLCVETLHSIYNPTLPSEIARSADTRVEPSRRRRCAAYAIYVNRCAPLTTPLSLLSSIHASLSLSASDPPPSPHSQLRVN